LTYFLICVIPVDFVDQLTLTIFKDD